MPISANRWEVVTPSKFEWEQEALDFIRQRGPDTILHAWSNFEFTSSQGAIYEVDLLLLTTGGLYLIEIKSRPGRIEGDATNWIWDGRILDNPVILANRKAKALKGLIERQLDKSRQITIPWVSELVFLSNAGTRAQLPADVMSKVYQREQLIAALSPGGPLITRERRPVDRRAEAALVKAIKDAGVRASRKALQAGDYTLEKLIDEGPGYQDFLAHHVSLKQVVRRVRQFSVARASSLGEREMVLRAARRDFTLLEGVNHPGILRPVDFTDNDYGAALIFEYDETALRLDKWLTQHKDADAKTRTAIWRQIADALRYAHSRRILHRALSPLSVLVYPNGQVKLMNWHTGARQEGTTGTVHVEELVESKAAVYLAPESLKAPDQASPAADVFSLGCIGFLLFSGRPPAADFLQLQALLRQHQALSLARVVDGTDADIDSLIELCTHPNPIERIPLDEFFNFLPDIEEKFAPQVEASPNPICLHVGWS
ncbi:MAG TPA: NERD domain-containing protein [Candidatus Xenobia bacterium]|jgi:serine/threonine protein kinase